MSTLWNVDTTGDLVVGSVATRSQTQIQQNILPIVYTNSTSITATLNTQYVIQSGGNWVLNLPSSNTIGDRIKVTTNFAGGSIQLAALNYVITGNRSTTLGGTVSTTDEGATIVLVHDGNFGGQREWFVESVTGNWIGSGSPNNFDINAIFDYANDGNGAKSADFATRSLLFPNGRNALNWGTNANTDLSDSGNNKTKVDYLSVFAGSQGMAGTANLVGGTINITVLGATSSSIPMVCNQFAGGSSNVGQLFAVCSTNTLTVVSSNGADNGPINFVVFFTHT